MTTRYIRAVFNISAFTLQCTKRNKYIYTAYTKNADFLAYIYNNNCIYLLVTISSIYSLS